MMDSNGANIVVSIHEKCLIYIYIPTIKDRKYIKKRGLKDVLDNVI